MEHENRLKELSDSSKHNNIHVIWVPEEEREKGAENLFQEIAENVSNLSKWTDFQIQEAQGTPIKINKSRPTPRHIVVKFVKYSDKEQVLKAEKQNKSLP